MTESLTVSVALCTFNGERFVREQVESILAQTLPVGEIVVADDGSADSTLSIVTDLVGHASPQPRLTVLTGTSPLGVAANFGRAIAACTGDVVVLSDQDDVWRGDRVQHLVARFSADEHLLLLHGDADLIDDDDQPIGSTLFRALGITTSIEDAVHAGNAFEVLMRRNLVTGATCGFRRGLADLALPVPEGWLHDEWLGIVAAVIGRVDLTTERLVRYRQHGANQVGARELSMAGKFGRILEPGAERNRRLLARAASLEQRLSQLPGVAPDRTAAAAAKLAHETVRSRLVPQRGRRVAPVLRELATGRYSRYGRGAADAVRDILQPLESAA